MTKKTRFINKLTALSHKEKAQVISFFSKYPNYENRIDWNNINLQYSDFEKVFKLAEKSKNKQKLKAKESPRFLFENFNCKILCQTEDFIVVVPLDWECAVFLNSFNCGGEGAKWCIGDSNNPSHWYNHIQKDDIFAFVLFTKRQFHFGKKIVFQYNTKYKWFSIWLQNNNGITSELYINFLFKYFNLLNKNWIYIVYPLFFVFRKYNKRIAHVFKIIQNDLPKIENKILNIMSVPEFVIIKSKLTNWFNKKETEVIIPKGVTSIGSWVFDDHKLKKIHIPDTVQSIGLGAFSDCQKLKTINIPDSVKKIETFAFAWCKNLEKVNIPNGVEAIEYGTFVLCKNFNSICLPDSIKTIEGSAFNGCKKLTKINLPNELTSIGKSAFAFCESLKTIDIPQSVKSIDKKAFFGCKNLESVNISKDTRVARNAFKGCKKVKIIKH